MILAFVNTVNASNNEIYFTYIKSGKINSFEEEYEKIEVDFNGEISWAINQSGFTFDAHCGNETSELRSAEMLETCTVSPSPPIAAGGGFRFKSSGFRSERVCFAAVW